MGIEDVWAADSLGACPSTIAVECANNGSTRDCWDTYTEHRLRCTDLICRFAGASRHAPRALCILGAGNLNDVVLPELGTAFSTIQLVDVDRQAVLDGVSRQTRGVEVSAAIHVLAPIDVSGIADDLVPGFHRKHGAAALDQLECKIVRQVAQFSPLSTETLSASNPCSPTEFWRPLIGQFDVVASCCILSQILRQVSDTFGADAQRCLRVADSVVAAHLALMTALTRPGGSALLITDVARIGETTSAPANNMRETPSVPLVGPPPGTHKQFSCLTGEYILGQLQRPEMLPFVTNTVQHVQWPWRVNSERLYSCYAVQFVRSTVKWHGAIANAEARMAESLRRFSARTGVAVQTFRTG